jgi:hypothetical protein
MDKYLAKAKVFFENYIQFVALGIAGLVLLWVVFTYVINPEVNAEVGGREVGPGDVDAVVYETSGKQLERAYQRPNVYTEVTEEDVQVVLDQQPPRPLPDGVGSAVARVIRPSPQPTFERIDASQEVLKVAQLPTPPAARIDVVNDWKGYYDVPVEPGSTTAEPEDLVGVVVTWAIPMEELRTRFNQAALPSRVQQTTLLDVQLVRQRLMENGEFGETTPIGSLRNRDWPTLPEGSADRETKRDYLEFVQADPALIALPPFYPLIAGERVEVAAAGEQPEVEPEQPEEQVNPRPRGNRNPNGNRGGRGGGQGGQGPGNPYGGNPYGGDPYGEDPYGGNPYGGNPYGGPPGQGSRPGAPSGRNQAPEIAFEGGVTPPVFNPAQSTGDLTGWAFDETAEPGETYRYNVVYSLRNPLFDTTNVADEPALEEQLSLQVARDETWEESWSEPIEVERVTRWFMRNAGAEIEGRLQNARFSVFRFQQGKWHEEQFTVVAGEALGSVRDGINYFTDRYLVDVRRDPSRDETVALLSSPTGGLNPHTPDEDDSEAYEELEELASPADEVAGR